MMYRFAAIPLEVLADLRLKLRALRVLLVLLMHVNRKKGMDGLLVWPSRKELSGWTGYHPKVISKVTSDLQRLGWLRKVGNGGCSRSARYVLATSIPGSAAEAIVQQMTKRRQDKEDVGDERADARSDGATTTETLQGQNEDGGGPKSGTQRSSNQGIARPQNGEGQRTDRIEQKKKREEEQCARDRLAHTLVSSFLSSFRGLGFGVPTDCTARQLAAWCEDMLALIDDGVSPNDISLVQDWLLNENRERDHDGNIHPFVVRTPTDLREKWSRLYEAVARDRNLARTLEGSPDYVRVHNLRRYVESLFAVPVDGVEGGEYDEDEVHLARLLDPRNKVPPHIAFCFCVERLFPEGVKLVSSYTAAVRENSGLSAALNRVFPDLCQARYEELRSIAGDTRSNLAASDREGQEAHDINWSGGTDDPGGHDGGEEQDGDDHEGDEDDDHGGGDFEDDLDAEACEGDDEM